MSTYRDDSIGVYGATGCVEERSDGIRRLRGHVLTEHGIVVVDGEDSRDHPQTRMRFVWQSTLHIRTWDILYTKRGCTLLARRFAEEVINRA